MFVVELSVRKDCWRNLALGCVLSTLTSDEIKYFQISLVIFSPHVVPILKSGNGELVAVDALLQLCIYPACHFVLLWHKRAMSEVAMTLWGAVQWKTLERGVGSLLSAGSWNLGDTLRERLGVCAVSQPCPAAKGFQTRGVNSCLRLSAGVICASDGLGLGAGLLGHCPSSDQYGISLPLTSPHMKAKFFQRRP